MSLSDSGGDWLRRGRQLADDASVRSHTHQVPSPTTPPRQLSISRSPPEKTRPLSWDDRSLGRRQSPPLETRTLHHSQRPRGPKFRHSTSEIPRDPSSHVSERLVVPNPTRGGGSRPRASPSVSTQSSIGRLSPSILSTSSAAYSYAYLEKEQFRLIRLHHGRKEDPEDIVRCQIFPFTLSDPPAYVALSYAWGDVSRKRKILVGDLFISVSASLDSALRTLRDPRESRWVWADALCINQQDESEKGDQVRLMTRIYHQAESVAIYLGPRSEDSHLAMELIEKVSNKAGIPRKITSLTPTPFSEQNFAAVVALFEREYWHRLWVVQEVFNARVIHVHCGLSVLPWEAFRAASVAFWKYRDVLDRNFEPRYSNNFHHARFGSYPQVLVHGGPRSLEGISTLDRFKDCDAVSDHEAFRDLLTVMRICRPKQTSDPRDKVFGILGVLLEKVRNGIEVNYGIPVKDVYMNVFRAVVEKTNSLDILCDSIHSPTYSNKYNLPSWTPDWSHRLLISPISTIHPETFSASRNAKVIADFTERNKLKVSAIPLGSVKDYGITVGTRCTVNDYLMAFLQWRACLLQVADGKSDDYLRWLQQRFCLALSLDQTPGYKEPEDWMDICYHVFACLIRDRLPKLHMDQELERYTEKDFQMNYDKRRRFLHRLGSNMMGRCFCITKERRVGLGTGSMTQGDIVVIPLGCSTPVILHPEGDGYRFVGDVYIHGYMYGRAVEECDAGDSERQVRSYVIH